MPRVKTGVVRRRAHKKVLKQNKGFRGTNSRLYKRAKEANLHAGKYAYIGRRLRKRDMRKLWILRITAALNKFGSAINYSRFVNGLKKANIALNRKMLSQLAINDDKAFKAVVEQVEKAK
ncbi:MAG: 50S ribosomal protein L20 [Candidatus Pacebacteria bacterium]|jgi:large subunit ribosomal protein L20|nr:50S ribosomal protein L20 [Candidatus Paceibacterota bacterium]